MAERTKREDRVDGLKDALEFLRDESIRLNQRAVTHAIVRALTIISAQTVVERPQERLH